MSERPDKLNKACPYTRVEWLENVGWSRVFLPVFPHAGDVVEIESELCYSDVSFRQSELPGSAEPWFFWGVYDTPTWYAGGKDTLYSQVPADTEWHVFRLVSLGPESGLWVDDRKIIDIKQYPGVVYAPDGIELWSYSNGRRNSLNKKKWLRISINGRLVMHLLPVLDDNGTPALYDTVSRQLFYNTGEDELVAGPVLNASGFRRVEYLEGLGSQYCSIPVTLDGSGAAPFVCVSDILFLGNSRQLMGFSTNACCYWGVTADLTSLELGSSVLLPTDARSRNSIRFTRVQNVATLECNGQGVSRSTGDPAGAFSAYGLFRPAVRHMETDVCQARVYGVQIYENGILTRSLLPALDSVGVACLYDEISRESFYSEGETDFIAGPLL